MEIECKNCHYHYDFRRYGEACPQCHFENKPFRSQAARRLMGYRDDSLRSFLLSDDRAERREAFLRSGDPDYGKSPLRRVRRYLMLLAICFAVLLLGQSLTRISYLSRAPQAAGEKPPVSSLASAAFHARFHSVQGVALLVRYTGTVPDEKLGKGQQGKKRCIFVDVSAALESTAPKSLPGVLFLRVGEAAYPRKSPAGDGADLSAYTAFDYRDVRSHGYATGQFFFYVPPDTESFTLCWLDPVTGTEQQAELHL